MENIVIAKGGLELTLCLPSFENGYYRGTRFDHSGIFRKTVLDGFTLADEWFDNYNPLSHDAVCGTSEEFGESGYADAEVGDVFIKPGVGLLLKEDDAPYDHFKLYKVADSGSWTVTTNDDEAVFIHVVDSDDWGYVYEKVVRIIDGNHYEISHRLCNTGQKKFEGEMYNHNFFTFGEAKPGPEIEIDFPFEPCGNWRAEYDSVALSNSGIRFSRPIEKGESVFMGNLKPSDGSDVTGEVFSMSAAGHRVTFGADLPFHRIAFWSNHRVGCIEPFIPYCLEPGDELEWAYTYEMKKGAE